MSIEIRAVESREVPRLIAFLNKTREEQGESRLSSRQCEEINSGTYAEYLVALSGRKLVGYIRRGTSGKGGFMLNLYVIKEYKEKKIESMLQERANQM